MAAGLLAAVLFGLVSFALVDRPLIAAGIVFAVTLFQAARTLHRVRRDGPDAALPEPPAPGPAAPPDRRLDAADALLVVQRFKVLGDRYDLAMLGADGRSAGEPVARVDRAPFRARERLEAVGDNGERLFRVEAQQILDIGGRYVVTDRSGERVGELRKFVVASLLRSTWEIWDGTGTLVATARERSLPLAVFRRFVDALPLPIPYHFDIQGLDGEAIGTVVRLRMLRDRYVIELPGDPDRKIDRRLALALAVALDALQDR